MQGIKPPDDPAPDPEEPAEVFAPPRFQGIEEAAKRVNEAVANLNEAMLELQSRHGVEIEIEISSEIFMEMSGYPDIPARCISLEMKAKL